MTSNKQANFSEEVPFLPRILIGIVDRVARYPLLTLIVVGTMLVLSVAAACTRLTFLTHRNDLVSPTKKHQHLWQQYIDEFGDDDDLVVVLKGGKRSRMQEAMEDLADKVRKHPKMFERVFYKADLRALHNRALLFKSTTEIRKIQDDVREMQFLLEPPILNHADPLLGWKAMSLSQMFGEAEGRAFLNRKADQLNNHDRAFFDRIAAISLTSAETLDDPKNYKTPWESYMGDEESAQQEVMLTEPQYFFSPDGDLAFFLASPIQDKSSFTSSEDSIAKMRIILDDLRQRYPDLNIGLTGLPVLENDEMLATRTDSITASWVALLFVAGLYLLVYRCIRYPFLTVSTLLVGTVLALGWLTITVGHLNILSATFAVMLIGLGDYGVLWVTRYEQERAAGNDVTGAMRITTRHVGPSILTASVTTAAAFFSAMLSDFLAVIELGWIAGSGVLLCGFACFTFLPAMVRLVDRKEPVEKPTVAMPDRTIWLPFVTRNPRWVLVGVLALATVCGVYAFQVKFNHNLLEMQARGLESVKWELHLIEHTNGASWNAVSYTTTPEEARALKARFEKLPCVSRVVEVASLIPEKQDMKMAHVRDIQHRLRILPERGENIPHFTTPDPKDLDAKITRLVDKLGEICHNQPPPSVIRLRNNLSKLRTRIRTLPKDTVVKRLQIAENHIVMDLAENLHRLRDVSTPEEITVDDLPTPLRERYLGANGKWLLKIFPNQSLWEYEPLKKFAQSLQTVDPDSTGKPFSTLEGLEAMRDGFKWACIYAFLAMLIILAADFRNVRHTLLALTPLGLGLILTFGVMGLFGIPLNLANIIALPLLLGLGADNGVHILHDYLSNRNGKQYALGYCTGRGILVAALTTIFGFGTLMLSRHQGLFSLGLVLALGVSCCLLTALVFLPAMLRLLPSKAGVEETREPPFRRKVG